jgi:hypothetical protein
MSCIFGENRDILFPKLSAELNLITFSEIAERYLKDKGLTPYICESEEEAREMALKENKNEWPCLFSMSDTTGEKDFEEFYTENELLDMESYINLGVIKNNLSFNSEKLDYFENLITSMKNTKTWTKDQLVELFKELIPNFGHKETGKYLDSKM